MKTESYISYLEDVVLALLEERNKDDEFKASKDTKDPSFKDGVTFYPHNVREAIAEHRKISTTFIKIDATVAENVRVPVRILPCANCGEDRTIRYENEQWVGLMVGLGGCGCHTVKCMTCGINVEHYVPSEYPPKISGLKQLRIWNLLRCVDAWNSRCSTKVSGLPSPGGNSSE